MNCKHLTSGNEIVVLLLKKRRVHVLLHPINLLESINYEKQRLQPLLHPINLLEEQRLQLLLHPMNLPEKHNLQLLLHPINLLEKHNLQLLLHPINLLEKRRLEVLLHPIILLEEQRLQILLHPGSSPNIFPETGPACSDMKLRMTISTHEVAVRALVYTGWWSHRCPAHRTTWAG